MTLDQPFTISAVADNLHRVCVIRWLVIAGCALSLVAAVLAGLQLPVAPIAAILAIMAAYTGLCEWRLRQEWPVTEQEFTLHLLADVAVHSSLLFLSGGPNNPFVYYLLVPLSISAATLPSRYTWAMALACNGSYTALLFWHRPLEIFQVSHHGGAPNLHLLGMWINFLFSTLLITWFVVQMASALRRRERLLDELRDDERQSEQLLAVATLAAGTAHELGTPLATIALLAEDLRSDYGEDPRLRDDLALLQGQVAQCKGILQKLAGAAEPTTSRDLIRPIAALMQDALAHWQLLRPEVSYEYHSGIDLPGPPVGGGIYLEQAVINLLNNAADACPDDIRVRLEQADGRVRLLIDDHGPGIPLELAEQLGKPFITGKGKGLGLGLYLSHATVGRHGGRITLYPGEGGGTRAELLMPIADDAVAR